ncbi:MAG: nucleoside-diphosphate sugar epimerase/dehydratase [bacterium]|nr:nucleoside-diphosphate sugar epimerase/dehydratase [bacterium]
MDLLERLNPYRRVLILAMDVGISAVSLFLAFLMLGGGGIAPGMVTGFLAGLALMVPVRLLVFNFSGLYRGIMKYASIDDLKNIFRAVSLGSLLFFFLLLLLRGLHVEAYQDFPKWVMPVDWMLNIIFIGGSRFMVRALRSYRPTALPEAARVLIVGAGDAGESILREIHFNPRSNYEVVGLLDDDPGKLHKQIHGVLVLGNSQMLGEVFESYDVDQVFIAVPNAPAELVRRIVEQCRRHNVTFRKLPGVRDLIDGKVSVSQLREVQLEDLLGRDAVKLDLPSIGRIITDQVVLVTGAAGSIGSELCRQVLAYGPKRLICFDHNENGLYSLMQEFSSRPDRHHIDPVVGSIVEAGRVEWLCSTWKPAVVFHAAAHKHVPMMERNRDEAVRNNILGTRLLAEAAHRHQVDKFVMISTDKAVNPTSTMGVCKRVAELLVRELDSRSATQFMTVRFGNVLGSAGSVVPLFRSQIGAGGPITITHPEIERYFMTIFEAVQLVIQAAALGEGGEIFVLDMGTPMKIIDMARNLITLSGLQEGVDIDIEIVGLRPGEKMSEELWVTGERLLPTRHVKISVAVPDQEADAVVLNGRLEELLAMVDQGRDEELLRLLRALVPTYTPVAGENKRF